METDKKEIAQWVTDFQNGDQEAFTKLYYATNDSGYFTALKITKDPDEAQDILQESYIAVMQKIGELKQPESFVGWFHQIVANRAKNALTKKKPSLFQTNEEEQTLLDFLPDTDEAFQPEDSVDQEDVRDKIMEIIDGLSDEKRTCVLLYYYNEMSVGDIAKSMDVPENTIKTRLFQARKDIKKGVEALQKKNVYLRSAAPISLVIWALHMAGKNEGGSFAAGPAAAAVLEGATAASTAATAGTSAAIAAASAEAAVGAAQTAAGTAGGFLAKMAAMTAAQKVAAGLLAAGIVSGAAAGTTAVVRNRAKQEEPAVSVLETVTQETEYSDSVISFRTEPSTEVLSELDTHQAKPVSTPISETVSATARQVTAAVSGSAEAHATTAVPETTAKVCTTGFTVPSTTTTTQKKTTTTTTRPTTTQASTTAPSTTAATTTTTQSDNSHSPVITTTSTKPASAAVTVSYSVADYDDNGTVSFTVDVGSAITTAMVMQAVQNKLSAAYGSDLEIHIRTGSAVDSAEETTYAFDVIVYAD